MIWFQKRLKKLETPINNFGVFHFGDEIVILCLLELEVLNY